jgi:hypothetical protein
MTMNAQNSKGDRPVIVSRAKRIGTVGALIVVLAASGVTRADEAEAIKALKKLGATFLYVDNKPGNPVRTVYLPGPKVTDASLKELKAFEQLQMLKLDSAKNITDEGVKELASLTKLEDLGLGSTQVTDAGLKHLAELKELKALSLSFTNITDAGLKELAAHKKLETLGLSFTKVTKDGVKELQDALPKCKIFH